jgi:hypothetical protein
VNFHCIVTVRLPIHFIVVLDARIRFRLHCENLAARLRPEIGPFLGRFLNLLFPL